MSERVTKRNDKGRQSRKARHTLGKGHFYFILKELRTKQNVKPCYYSYTKKNYAHARFGKLWL